MPTKITKNTHFRPNLIIVLIAVIAICASVAAIYWGAVYMPLSDALKVLAMIFIVLVALLVCFASGMNLIHQLYSKGVWATPEEQKMTFPGDDLVKDPKGKKHLRIRQARDLDAPLEEVWKHIYQMDPTKGGMYAWSNCERLFGMNVDNAYSLQGMWQGEDACKPGDFWPWSYAGFGAEVADLVPNKYIVWFADTRDAVRTPGASYMLFPGLKYCIWYWTIALKPLDGGSRCRIYSFYDIAYGPHNPINTAIQKLIIGMGGAMMGRRAMRNLELSARVERRKSIPLRAQGALLGRSHGDDPRLHKRIPFPDLRWGREFPRVESKRAAITDDPNWPPVEGQDYVPPIEDNNVKHGWTPEKKVENDRKADERQVELLAKLNMV